MSRITSRAVNEWPNTENHGFVSPISHATVESSARRMIRASERPMINACLRLSSGSREDKMEIKTRLSIPSTTSSRMSVPNPPHAVGSATHEKSRNIYAPSPNMGNAVAIERMRLDKKD